MDDEQALLTAARRYCHERGAMWLRRYIAAAWRHDPLTWRHRRRFVFLRSLLEALDRSALASGGNGMGGRALLRSLAQGASGEDSKADDSEGNQDGQDLADLEERDLFVAYVGSLDPEALRQVQRLGYRRPIGGDQSRWIRTELAARWGISPHEHPWYPLSLERQPENVEVLRSYDLYEQVPPERLQAAMERHGITSVLEVHAKGPEGPRFGDAEVDVDRFDPAFLSLADECYVTTERVDWVLYTSHERSTTFAGERILSVLRDAWPGWERFRYAPYR